MGKVEHPEDLVERIRRLEREVATLRRGSTLNSSVVSQGTVEVRTPSGQVIQRIGAIPWAGTTVFGQAAYRADGSISYINWDTSDGGGYWAWFDEQGNYCLSNDTNSNQGLATPYLQVAAMPYSSVLTPPQSTTSGSFTPLHRCHFQKQQPWLRTYLITQADAGTTGEVRLAVAGSAISDVDEIPDSDNSYRTVDGEVAGNHLAFCAVDVEARRVSGAGSIRVAVAFASGRQS